MKTTETRARVWIERETSHRRGVPRWRVWQKGNPGYADILQGCCKDMNAAAKVARVIARAVGATGFVVMI